MVYVISAYSQIVHAEDGHGSVMRIATVGAEDFVSLQSISLLVVGSIAADMTAV